MKIKVGVLFGGKTVEHEISVISAIQAMGYLNREKYDVIPIYITTNNEFYVGENVAEDEKSIAFSLTFSDPTKTLSDEEVTVVFDKIITEVESKVNAKLRSK